MSSILHKRRTNKRQQQLKRERDGRGDMVGMGLRTCFLKFILSEVQHKLSFPSYYIFFQIKQNTKRCCSKTKQGHQIAMPRIENQEQPSTRGVHDPDIKAQ